MSERVREDIFLLQRIPDMPSGFSAEELAFLAEQRRAEMFVTVSTYKAKPGEEDAIIALHENWQRNLQPRATGYLSGELLRNDHDHNEFVAIMRFENRESAQALANDAEQAAWYKRLVSLVEHAPLLAEYASEWRGD